MRDWKGRQTVQSLIPFCLELSLLNYQYRIYLTDEEEHKQSQRLFE